MPNADKGRSRVFLVAGLLLATDVLVDIAHIARFGPRQVPQQLIRFLLTFAICWLLVQGKAWVRWLTVALASAGTLLVAVAALGALAGGQVGAGLALGLMASVYATSAAMLLFSSDVASHFAAAKSVQAASRA